MDKYNKFSQMFMKGKAISQGVQVDARKMRRATELSELNKEQEPAYLPLHFGSIPSSSSLEPVKEEEEGVSAFAKSAFAVKKSARPPPPHQIKMTSEILLASLHTAFPTPQRALNCFYADLKSLDALSAAAQKAAISAGQFCAYCTCFGVKRMELHIDHCIVCNGRLNPATVSLT